MWNWIDKAKKLQNQSKKVLSDSVAKIKEKVKTAPKSAEELGVYYVNDRIMGMPSPSSSKSRMKEIAKFLDVNYEGKYMVWNLSEETYDATPFHDEVISYNFPGHPAPPLGLLLKIVTSMSSWLSANESNVVVCHCVSGQSRTVVVLSCLLAWLGEFGNAIDSLDHINKVLGLESSSLVPSQMRYVKYFADVMKLTRPHAVPLSLHHIVLHGIPSFGCYKDGSGCRPLLQLYKDGKLVYSSSKRHKVRAYGEDQGSLRFDVDSDIQGDILVRCRHIVVGEDKKIADKLTMFRTAFHTGYVRQHVLELSQKDLDLAKGDTRFPEDFKIEFVFLPGGRSAPSANNSEKTEADELIHSPDLWAAIDRRVNLLKQPKPKTPKQPTKLVTKSNIAANTPLPQSGTTTPTPGKIPNKKQNKEGDISTDSPKLVASPVKSSDLNIDIEGDDFSIEEIDKLAESGKPMSGDSTLPPVADLSVEDMLNEMAELERDLGLEAFSEELRSSATSNPLDDDDVAALDLSEFE